MQVLIWLCLTFAFGAVPIYSLLKFIDGLGYTRRRILVAQSRRLPVVPPVQTDKGRKVGLVYSEDKRIIENRSLSVPSMSA
jgi:hypothetical protein